MEMRQEHEPQYAGRKRLTTALEVVGGVVATTAAVDLARRFIRIGRDLREIDHEWLKDSSPEAAEANRLHRRAEWILSTKQLAGDTLVGSGATALAAGIVAYQHFRRRQIKK